MLDTIVRKFSKLSSFNGNHRSPNADQTTLQLSKLGMLRSSSSGDVHHARNGKQQRPTVKQTQQRCVIELREMTARQTTMTPQTMATGCSCCQDHVLNESNDLIFKATRGEMNSCKLFVFSAGKTSGEEHIYEEIEDEATSGTAGRSAVSKRYRCEMRQQHQPVQNFREELVNEVVTTTGQCGSYLNSSSMRKKSVRFQPVIIQTVNVADLPRTPSTSSGSVKVTVPPHPLTTVNRGAPCSSCCCKCKCMHYLNDTISTVDCSSPPNSARNVQSHLTTGILKKHAERENESQAFYSASLPTPPSLAAAYDETTGFHRQLNSLPRNSNTDSLCSNHGGQIIKKDSSSTSSSSSISCNTYTTNSINSNSSFSSNHSATFNCMIEDFINHLSVAKESVEDSTNLKNSERPVGVSKKDSLDSKSSVASSFDRSTTASMSPVSAKSFDSAGSKSLNEKLSFRVTNFTIEDLKSRQQMINKFTTLQHARNSYHPSRRVPTMTMKSSAMMVDGSSTIQV